MLARIAGLHLYPVKGCRGLSVDAAEIDALGLAGDRRFMVVDATGRFLSQRSHPALALVGTALDATHLTLTVAGRAPLRVPRASDPAASLRTVEVWSSQGLQAEDCGDAAAAWIGEVIGDAVRLVRIGPAFLRPVKPSKARPGDVVSFADAYPLLVIGTTSLADLNDRLIARGEAPVPMNRFRPNLVVEGCAPYAEDGWARFRIGAAVFRAAGTCVRCIVTTTDQETARREGPEPLRTLATYRRDPGDGTGVIFGQNVIHETKSGRLRVGDAVEAVWQ